MKHTKMFLFLASITMVASVSAAGEVKKDKRVKMLGNELHNGITYCPMLERYDQARLLGTIIDHNAEDLSISQKLEALNFERDGKNVIDASAECPSCNAYTHLLQRDQKLFNFLVNELGVGNLTENQIFQSNELTEKVREFYNR